MSAPNLPEADGYQPGEGFQSLIGNGPPAREVIKSTLIIGAFIGLRELLALYVGRQATLRIFDLFGAAVLIGLSALILLRSPLNQSSTPKEERGTRLVFIVFLIAGSALATLSIHTLFFAE